MGKRVVFAVTGSIAAFKAATLASDMVKRGLEVRAIVTDGAAQFVTPLTFEALTGNSAGTDIWEEQPGSSRMGHLELARWADVLLVAPASAGAIARIALGLTDDLLGAVALACPAPLMIAPAMETHMYEHPATQEHLRVLRERRAEIIGPEIGRLASGAMGTGRMTEPEMILVRLFQLLEVGQDMAGLRVLVTAGPTYEPIDPVRFIGNRSSGKMGYAVAEVAAERGADVLLISGPSDLPVPPGVDFMRIETSAEMREAVLRNLTDRAALVMAAAVADFRPERVSGGKLTRSEGMTLKLAPTSDIAAEASKSARRAVHVGFALETSDLLASARAKLQRKGQDLVVGNAVSDQHSPFGSETNRVIFVTRDGAEELPEMPKRDVAQRLWDEVVKLLETKRAT